MPSDIHIELLSSKTSHGCLAAHIDEVRRVGSRALVRNIATRLESIVSNSEIIPFTVNDTEYDNSAICSEYSAFMAILPTLAGLPRIWSAPLRALVRLSAVALRACHIDKALRPFNEITHFRFPAALNEALMQDITGRLTQAYPGHAIKLYGLCYEIDSTALNYLERMGYLIIALRPAYVSLMRGKQDLPGILRRNLAAYQRVTTHEWVNPATLTDQDYDRIAELYASVNRSPDRQENPDRTALSYQHNQATDRAQLLAVRSRSSGLIDAFLEFDVHHDVCRTVSVGFDKNVAAGVQHYYGLMSNLLCAAALHDIPVRLGFGAGRFKRNRGARPVIEYNAFYVRHLPFCRRVIMRCLAVAMNRIGRAVMLRMHALDAGDDAVTRGQHAKEKARQIRQA